MKKFADILKEVNKTHKTIKEVDEKINELQNTYLNIMDLKERHEQRKNVENDIVILEEKKKDLQITVKILNSNAKIALFNETMPTVLEALAKYKNKPYGPKTEEKIKELKKLYKKAYEKQKELAEICGKYNDLTVGNIKNIYKDKNIYPNMKI